MGGGIKSTYHSLEGYPGAAVVPGVPHVNWPVPRRWTEESRGVHAVPAQVRYLPEHKIRRLNYAHLADFHVPAKNTFCYFTKIRQKRLYNVCLKNPLTIVLMEKGEGLNFSTFLKNIFTAKIMIFQRCLRVRLDH